MSIDFKKWLAILSMVAPFVLMAVPGGMQLAPLVPVIVAGIADAQKKPGASGPEKKAFVLQLVTDAVTGANLAKPGEVDAPLVLEASGHAIDAIIATVKAVQKAHEALPAAPAMLTALVVD